MVNGKRLLSWGSYESRVSLAESPSKCVRDHLGKARVGLSRVLILAGGLPALNFQVLFWAFSSVGWSLFQEAGIRRFISP